MCIVRSFPTTIANVIIPMSILKTKSAIDSCLIIITLCVYICISMKIITVVKNIQIAVKATQNCITVC